MIDGEVVKELEREENKLIGNLGSVEDVSRAMFNLRNLCQTD